MDPVADLTSVLVKSSQPWGWLKQLLWVAKWQGCLAPFRPFIQQAATVVFLSYFEESVCGKVATTITSLSTCWLRKNPGEQGEVDCNHPLSTPLILPPKSDNKNLTQLLLPPQKDSQVGKERTTRWAELVPHPSALVNFSDNGTLHIIF